ncbi:MAG: hypothetical protein O2856_20065 [Planctomycetota bacterium]|nr:hypothetical protein [Planctomycetota bacterium]
MNELEQQIRELKLRTPGDVLDRRMSSLLQGSGDNATPESESAVHLATSLCATDRIRTRRGVFSATFAGLGVALLFGIVIGNGLPSFWSVSGLLKSQKPSPSTTERAVISVQEQDTELPVRHPMLPDLPIRVRDALQSQSTVGSQFVESNYLSAIMGAAIWERQNGEVFNVTTHVSDRRFDMCRDCHRVGG